MQGGVALTGVEGQDWAVTIERRQWAAAAETGPVDVWTLRTTGGLRARISTLGATIIGLDVLIALSPWRMSCSALTRWNAISPQCARHLGRISAARSAVTPIGSAAHTLSLMAGPMRSLVIRGETIFMEALSVWIPPFGGASRLPAASV